MNEDKQNVNLSITDGETFFANEVSINFNPNNFFIDFKCISPRIDPRTQNGATFTLKHNVVIMEPYALKEMIGMMKEIIERYEKDFGRIEKPKAAKAAEKKKKKKTKTKSKTSAGVETPGYFG